MKNLSQDNWHPCQESNLMPSKYKPGVIQTIINVAKCTFNDTTTEKIYDQLEKILIYIQKK